MLTCTSEIVTDVGVMMSLWKHECYRVIADRFTEYADKDWFEKNIKQVSPTIQLSVILNLCNKFKGCRLLIGMILGILS